jgi:hypothetical protein
MGAAQSSCQPRRTPSLEIRLIEIERRARLPAAGKQIIHSSIARFCNRLKQHGSWKLSLCQTQFGQSQVFFVSLVAPIFWAVYKKLKSRAELGFKGSIYSQTFPQVRWIAAPLKRASFLFEASSRHRPPIGADAPEGNSTGRGLCRQGAAKHNLR